ncbi:hypothetical protein G7068_16060 [Leucobacter viscericola]|uniref:Uncharacterized protein n=1 Tax=Leucobacter viscericola TaxID=2714935 RepID=A0A6G7XJL5_9MICO|nr:hypothetical protein [Leucobacter viscericola]QIK64561.1 hypothetical protein G7068_16060 [Leucobacter viscericola]
MTIDQIIEAIADYRDWIERQLFGAPIDVETYREHLEIEELREKAEPLGEKES